MDELGGKVTRSGVITDHLVFAIVCYDNSAATAEALRASGLTSHLPVVQWGRDNAGLSVRRYARPKVALGELARATRSPLV